VWSWTIDGGLQSASSASLWNNEDAETEITHVRLASDSSRARRVRRSARITVMRLDVVGRAVNAALTYAASSHVL